MILPSVDLPEPDSPVNRQHPDATTKQLTVVISTPQSNSAVQAGVVHRKKSVKPPAKQKSARHDALTGHVFGQIRQRRHHIGRM